MRALSGEGMVGSRAARFRGGQLGLAYFCCIFRHATFPSGIVLSWSQPGVLCGVEIKRNERRRAPGFFDCSHILSADCDVLCP